MSDTAIATDLSALDKLKSAHEQIREQMAKVIVGQDEVIEQLLIAILSRGHCVIEGVPGLAKTLMVQTLAQCMSLDFARIQFTPDLMPSDITGTDMLYEDAQTHEREFRFMTGPVFTNVLLADEINRTPPKTQAALLEGMQERQVSAGGKPYPLPDPFFVLATQNPIEQEGTYPLPEAQLDRFFMKIFVRYPTTDEEREIYKRMTGDTPTPPTPVLSAEQIIELQGIVRHVPISDLLLDYAMRLVRATRVEDESALDFIRQWVLWGVGSRGGQSLILAAKAKTALAGRSQVEQEDLTAIAPAVLRHRIVLNYNAEADGQTPDTVIERLIESLPLHDGATDVRIERVLKA